MEENGSDIFYNLISNGSFRDWVQRPNKENTYFWRKWMEEHPEDIAAVKKAREFIERMHFRKEQLSSSELDDLLGKIIVHEGTAYKSTAKKSRSVWSIFFSQWVRVAAILVICFITAVVHFGIVKEAPEEPGEAQVEWVVLENPKGRKSKVTLPDGTKVNLNYESRLEFPKVFQGNVRTVELIGEAFFEVVPHDSMPFIVQANGIETEVLGTSFNIRSYKDESETHVSLVTGKVKISETSEGSVDEGRYLVPGEQLNYNRNSGNVVVNTFDLESVTAWKEGIILFKDAGFEEFIDQLERWYGVDFQIYGRPSRKWNVNGRYQNEKLDDILIGLKFVYGLEYKIQGKNVILKLK